MSLEMGMGGLDYGCYALGEGNWETVTSKSPRRWEKRAHWNPKNEEVQEEKEEPGSLSELSSVEDLIALVEKKGKEALKSFRKED